MPNTCSQCGAALTSDSPQGLCARCLLSAAGAVGSEVTIDSPAPRPSGSDSQRQAGAVFVDIGNLGEVARRLPQFEIVELVGRGGMGVVYKARQVQLDRIVALKILPPGDAIAPGFIERFRREARSLAKLNHPNIVNVYDFGESDGLYYFVMEFVDGVTLRELIFGHTLTAAEALSVVPKICDALQFAHEEGVVHRDIKPENILIDKKGRVKIADFGLAKLLRRDQSDLTLTQSGATLGTIRYMAPEQLDKPDSVDHRADIYSLGVVFYEMLTGEIPMGRFALPSQKVQIDVRLDEIVLHALERDVERRYQHASQVRDDVENVTNSQRVAPTRSDGPALTPPDTGAAPTGFKDLPAALKRGARLRLIAAFAGYVILLLIGCLLTYLYWPQPTSDGIQYIFQSHSQAYQKVELRAMCPGFRSRVGNVRYAELTQDMEVTVSFTVDNGVTQSLTVDLRSLRNDVVGGASRRTAGNIILQFLGDHASKGTFPVDVSNAQVQMESAAIMSLLERWALQRPSTIEGFVPDNDLGGMFWQGSFGFQNDRSLPWLSGVEIAAYFVWFLVLTATYLRMAGSIKRKTLQRGRDIWEAEQTSRHPSRAKPASSVFPAKASHPAWQPTASPVASETRTPPPEIAAPATASRHPEVAVVLVATLIAVWLGIYVFDRHVQIGDSVLLIASHLLIPLGAVAAVAWLIAPRRR